MRLHRHDEIVEAMRSALDRLNPNTARKAMAAAALDAMLEAVVRLGVGEVSDVEFTGDANTQVALFLRMEARDDE